MVRETGSKSGAVIRPARSESPLRAAIGLPRSVSKGVESRARRGKEPHCSCALRDPPFSESTLDLAPSDSRVHGPWLG